MQLTQHSVDCFALQNIHFHGRLNVAKIRLNFPFVWVTTWNTFSDANWTLVVGAVGLPSFLPTVLLARSFDTHPGQVVWLGVLLTVVEATVGFWLIRTGARRTVAYFVLVMLLSIYGSMALNAGMRI